ncbi:MAG TPA: 1-acyl-sn-glycerol-3-phosphate acyltransferase, partial [Acidiferrobacterales bacterium]
MLLLKRIGRALLRLAYRVEVSGLEHYRGAGERVLIAPNHTSFLDAALLTLFLPDRLTFAVNTRVARAWWLRPLLKLVEFFPVDPANPYSLKSLIRFLQQDRRAVIFPEGRITVTGALMKIYHGPGLVADRSGALLLPVRIDGAQFTPFSRLRGRVRLRWFPKITLTILPPRRLSIPEEVRGRARRKLAGEQLADLMTEMMFVTSNWHRTIFQAVLDARRIHGGDHLIIEDIERKPLGYRQLVARSFILSRAVRQASRPGDYVGVLLPNAVATVIVFLALHLCRRTPAMLNYTVGAQGMGSACRIARITTVYTSRRFVTAAKLDKTIERLQQDVKVIFLEDLRGAIT